MSKRNKAARKGRTRKSSPGARRLKAVLKWCTFPLLCILGLYAGMWIGYVKLGGGSPDDVLRLETWTHVLDLVFKDT